MLPKITGNVCRLERNFKMPDKNLVFRSPLERLGCESEDLLEGGRFGAILARAGVGKTAFLVQVALNLLFRKKNVLHVSLGDSVKKVSLWYDEVLRNMTDKGNPEQIAAVEDALLKYRLIMSFTAGGFSFQKFEDRLAELGAQGIFSPRVMLIDGLNFDETERSDLARLKQVAETHSIPVWFTVRTHRHEAPGADGLPTQLEGIDDLFEILLQLQPVGKQVLLKVLKGKPASAGDAPLFLDPATLLIG